MRGDKVPLALEVEIPEGRPGGALGTVLERSRQLCLTTYEKPLLSDTSYLSDIRKCRQPVGPSAEPRYAGVLHNSLHGLYMFSSTACVAASEHVCMLSCMCVCCEYVCVHVYLCCLLFAASMLGCE